MADSAIVEEILEAARQGRPDTLSRMLEALSMKDSSLVPRPRFSGRHFDGSPLINVRNSLDKTALWMAVEQDDLMAVQALVGAGANIHMTYRAQQTVLILAASKGHLKILDILLGAGAMVDAVDSYGLSALMVSVEKGHEECLDMLVSAGARLDLKDIRGKDAVMIAVEENRWKCLKLLIQAGADFWSENFSQHMTPLYYAMKLDHFLCFDVLLYHGASVTVQDSARGETSLHVALEHSPWYFPLLLQAGARTDVQNKEGDTPLMLAASSGNVQAMPILIQAGAQIDITNKNGWTPLMLAAGAGKTEAVQYLISVGANMRQTDHSGKTSLILAAVAGHHLCVEILLANDPEGVDIKCASKKTALIHAIENYKVSCLKSLLRGKASTDVTDARGRTPLMCVIFKGLKDYYSKTDRARQVYECALALEEMDALNVNARDREKKTALIFASQLENFSMTVRLLLAVGGDVNWRDHREKSALAYAAEAGNFEALRLLVKAGAFVNLVDVSGWTPLHYLCKREPVPKIEACVTFLLNHGADVNAIDFNGMTCVMAAVCISWARSVLDILLSHGADVNIVDRYGGSALVYAIGHGDHKMDQVKALIESNVDISVGQANGRSAVELAVFYRNYATVKLLLEDKAEVALDWDCFRSLIYYDETKMMQLLAGQGAMPENSRTLFSHRSPVYNSILATVLKTKSEHFAKYFMAAGYLNIDDLQLRLPKECEKDLIVPRFPRLPPRRPSPEQEKIPSNLGHQVHSQPWPLVKLCFVTVSSCLGSGPGRAERVKQTQLPPKLQRMLMFQDRNAKICPSQWDKIPLEFHPERYERLPRPRPLLYYWPFGRELYPCDCHNCDAKGYKFWSADDSYRKHQESDEGSPGDQL